MNHATPNRSFYTAVAALLLACFLPAPFTNFFAGRLGELTIPLSAPLHKLSMIVRAVPERLDPEDPRLVELEIEVGRLRARNAQIETQAAVMAEQLDRLQGLRAIDPSFRYITASRVAESAGGKSALFKVGLGSLSGVPVGAFALYQGYQLVGRVSEVSPRSATITPITARAYGPITALVISEDGAFEKSVRCSLEPVGDGTFTGDVAKDEEHEAPAVRVGQRVVYHDTDLGQLNTGPLIGVIESVVPKDKAPPLWNTIVVRPRFRLSDVGVVDLRIPRRSDGGGN